MTASKVFSQKTTAAVFAFCCALHIAHAITAAEFKVGVAERYNAAAAALYLVLALSVALSKSRPVWVYAASFSEIVAFTLVGTVSVGSQAQFSCYIFGLLPLAFYAFYKAVGRNAAVASAALLVGLFYFESTFFYTRAPLYVLSLKETKALVRANSTVSVGLLLVFFALFLHYSEAERRSLEKKNEKLKGAANYDELTRLMNRKPIRHYFEDFVRSANERGRDFTLFVCDVDNFKAVNDSYGHLVGDAVLKAVAASIQSQLREEDVAFRWGGEEFLALVATGAQGGKASAERCRRAVESAEVECDGHEVSVTITIGICAYWTGATLDQMVEKADEAMYVGKRNGKNVVVADCKEEKQ